MSVTQQDILDAVSTATAAFQAEMDNWDQQLAQMQAQFQQQLGAANQAVQRANDSAAAAAVPGGPIDIRLRPSHRPPGEFRWREFAARLEHGLSQLRVGPVTSVG